VRHKRNVNFNKFQ